MVKRKEVKKTEVTFITPERPKSTIKKDFTRGIDLNEILKRFDEKLENIPLKAPTLIEIVSAINKFSTPAMKLKQIGMFIQQIVEELYETTYNSETISLQLKDGIDDKTLDEFDYILDYLYDEMDKYPIFTREQFEHQAEIDDKNNFIKEVQQTNEINESYMKEFLTQTQNGEYNINLKAYSILQDEIKELQRL